MVEFSDEVRGAQIKYQSSFAGMNHIAAYLQPIGF